MLLYKKLLLMTFGTTLVELMVWAWWRRVVIVEPVEAIPVLIC